MALRNPASPAQAERVYEQYVKPLEQAHQDEFVLVASDGQIIFAPTLLALAEKAQKTPSKDNFLFKVGDKVIGHLL